MKAMKILVLFAAVFGSVVAFADPSPVPSILPSVLPSPFPTNLPVIDVITNAIPDSATAKAGISMALGFIAEMAFRLWKTKKPRAFLLFASSTLLLGANVFIQLANFCQRSNALLDQVIPQNIKDDQV